ncbi:hypothetical protein P7K49_022403, partial [Saguinus oedipus]
CYRPRNPSKKPGSAEGRAWTELNSLTFYFPIVKTLTGTQEPALPQKYDSFGRLTNVTFPTGQVSSFRSDTDSSVHVQVETSSKDDVTITTNLSASGAFYTLLQ